LPSSTSNTICTLNLSAGVDTSDVGFDFLQFCSFAGPIIASTKPPEDLIGVISFEDFVVILHVSTFVIFSLLVFLNKFRNHIQFTKMHLLDFSISNTICTLNLSAGVDASDVGFDFLQFCSFVSHIIASMKPPEALIGVITFEVFIVNLHVSTSVIFSLVFLIKFHNHIQFKFISLTFSFLCFQFLRILAWKR
jgi:hypothetical protein